MLQSIFLVCFKPARSRPPIPLPAVAESLSFPCVAGTGILANRNPTWRLRGFARTVTTFYQSRRMLDESTLTPAPGKDTTQRLIAVCLVILTGITVIALVTFLGPVVKPVFVAVFLFFMIKPGADALHRLGLSRLLAYLVLFVGLLVVLFLLTRMVYKNVKELNAMLPAYQANAKALLVSLPGMDVDEWEGTSVLELLDITPGNIAQFAFATGLELAEAFLMIFLYLVFVILDAERMPLRVRKVFPNAGDRILAVATRISDGITGYMGVKTLVSTGMGITAALIMALLAWTIGPFGHS